MNDEVTGNMTDEEITDEDGQKLLERLTVMAERWCERLADPVIRKMIDDGQIVVSPLVKELIAAMEKRRAS
jgi:hypothetical protein